MWTALVSYRDPRARLLPRWKRIVHGSDREKARRGESIVARHSAEDHAASAYFVHFALATSGSVVVEILLPE
jgi:hypothetical protein